MNKFKHKTKKVSYMLDSEILVDIDIGILKRINELWRNNIHTFASCQGGVIDYEKIQTDLLSYERHIFYQNPWIICHTNGREFFKDKEYVKDIIDGPYSFNIEEFVNSLNREYSKDVITCIFKPI